MEADAEDAIGRWLFAQTCSFVAGAANEGALPPITLPEIAFAGRSNVGKSSLVNALTGRRTLARTSNTPGRTQQLNFFDLGGRLQLVDMPGYGYASVGKAAVARWEELIRRYLLGRASLLRVFLLIDSRHGLKPVDHESMAAFDKAAVSFAVVLTKVDEVKPAVLAATCASVEEGLRRHPAAFPELVVTSAQAGSGIPALRTAIVRLLEQRAPDSLPAPDLLTR